METGAEDHEPHMLSDDHELRTGSEDTEQQTVSDSQKTQTGDGDAGGRVIYVATYGEK